MTGHRSTRRRRLGLIEFILVMWAVIAVCIFLAILGVHL